MNKTNQTAVVAALLLMSSGVAGAQGHASHFAGSPVVARHSSSSARSGSRGATSGSTGRTVAAGTSNVTVLNGDSLTLQQLLNPVPGLGFDYPHLAAINSNLAVQALIDPLTQLRLAQAERLLRESPGVTPVFFGGYGGYVDSGSQPVEVQQPQPQIIVLQQPAPQPVPAVEPAPQPVAAPAPESRPGADQFILVLRDGSQITAVAFSRQDSRIVYITPEGSRRSLAISGLDAAATIRVNEERGTSLQLPL